MKVKMLKANWPYRAGDVETVDDKVGARWVDHQIAVEVVKDDGRQAKQRNPKRHEVKRKPKVAESTVKQTAIEIEEPVKAEIERPTQPEPTQPEPIKTEEPTQPGPVQPEPEPRKTEELSFPELRSEAKARGIEGSWKMKKVELIEALEAEALKAGE